jgi:hypothetical protein
VFADWLDEHDEHARAEFIRIQIELAQMADNDPRRAKLVEREVHLLHKHQTAWLGERLQVAPATAWVFQRGFPGALYRSLNSFSDEDAVILANSPHLANLSELHLCNGRIGDAGAAALAGSPHLSSLCTLDLRENQIGDAGLAALASSRHLANLTELNLKWNWWISIVDALVASPHLSKLSRLILTGARIGEDAALALRARFGDALVL